MWAHVLYNESESPSPVAFSNSVRYFSEMTNEMEKMGVNCRVRRPRVYGRHIKLELRGERPAICKALYYLIYASHIPPDTVAADRQIKKSVEKLYEWRKTREVAARKIIENQTTLAGSIF